MQVSHYFEWEEYVTGGHYQTVQNQRRILRERGIDYTTKPTLDADVLHLNNMGPKSLYYARKAQRRDVPVVIHTHQTAEDFRESFTFSNVLAKPLKPYLSYAYSHGDLLVCPSAHTATVMDDYCDVPTTVVSNGFDPDRLAGFEDLREEYLDRYDLDPPVVFMFGHVFLRKGLRAFVETARAMPELDFAWFGYLDPSGSALDRLLKDDETARLVENSPDNCTFTGYIEDPRGAFAAGDIFFWPSKNENEGMALLEAMACEKPALVRDIPTYDWLEDGHAVLKADAPEFRDELDRLKDPDLRERLGANAKAVSEDFTVDAVADDLVAVYDRVTRA